MPDAPSGGGVMGELKRVPIWVWVAGGIIIVGVLILRARSSGTSTAATPQVGSTSGTSQQDLASVVGQLQSLPTTASYTDLSTLVPQGFGWGLPNNGTGVISTPQGSWTMIGSQNLMDQLLQSGQTIYFQSAPGVFQALPADKASWIQRFASTHTATYQKLPTTAPVGGGAAYSNTHWGEIARSFAIHEAIAV